MNMNPFTPQKKVKKALQDKNTKTILHDSNFMGLFCKF